MQLMLQYSSSYITYTVYSELTGLFPFDISSAPTYHIH